MSRKRDKRSQRKKRGVSQRKELAERRKRDKRSQKREEAVKRGTSEARREIRKRLETEWAVDKN